MTASFNTKPAIGLLRLGPRPKDAEDIPLGSVVRTPTGQLARVEGYRGFRRGHRVWLVCRYLEPVNKRYDVVQLLPELVMVLEEERNHGT